MSIFDQRESDIRAYCRVYPVVFDTAQNARQTDSEGKSYIDFFAGAGVLNFGHNNPRMKKALINYLENDGVLHSLDLHTKAKQQFMERFTKTILEPRNMPHKMQFMGPTGTNSVEAALKLARRVTGRTNVIAFNKGFHGMTLGALACTANALFRGAAGVPLNNVSHALFDNDSTMPGSGMAGLEQLRAQLTESSSGCEKPAAILVETIQAEGGVNVASKEWLQGLEKLARDVGALFIVDDIQVGVGRTGSYFSFDGMDLDPDIICLAKGIGGIGTPLAMNLVKPDVDKHWSPGEHTGTFRGQNLSFVAGSEALSYFENNELMDSVKQKSVVMEEMLKPLLDLDSTIEVRGRGMVFGLDVGSGEKVKAIVSQCFSDGLLVSACGSGGRVIKLIPPLTIPDEDLLEGLEILVKNTKAVM